MKRKSLKVLLCSLISVILCLSMISTFTVAAYGEGTKYHEVRNESYGAYKFTALEGMAVAHDKSVSKSLNTIYPKEREKNKKYNPLIDGDLCAFSVKVVLTNGYKNRYARIYRTTLTKDNKKSKSQLLIPRLDSAVDKTKWGKHISSKKAFVDLLGHANDITAIQMNGYVNLFVATGNRGNTKSKTFYNMVQLRVIGNEVFFVKGYYIKDNYGKELKPYTITVSDNYKDGNNSVKFMVSPSVSNSEKTPVYTFKANLNNSHYRLANTTFKTSKMSYKVPFKKGYTMQSYFKNGNYFYVAYSSAGKNHENMSYITRYKLSSNELKEDSYKHLGYRDKSSKFEVESLFVVRNIVYYSVNTNEKPNDFIAGCKW